MTNAPRFPEEMGFSQDSSLERDAARLDECVARLAEARKMVSSIIFGQNDAVEQTLIGILSGGHVLMVGAPGLGKSLLAHTLGKVLGLLDKRVQFTPDLMPADILGSEVLEEGADGKRAFRFIKGPVFCQLLLADEINRASPRTQSALLQAMQEREVSVAGYSHKLPEPFHVVATQNPLEQEGTYPLPEAQLDRFLLEVRLGYPNADEERKIVTETTGRYPTRPRQV
ncbi:AAA family ATPase, partial [Thalassospira sp.]